MKGNVLLLTFRFYNIVIILVKLVGFDSNILDIGDSYCIYRDCEFVETPGTRNMT